MYIITLYKHLFFQPWYKVYQVNPPICLKFNLTIVADFFLLEFIIQSNSFLYRWLRLLQWLIFIIIFCNFSAISLLPDFIGDKDLHSYNNLTSEMMVILTHELGIRDHLSCAKQSLWHITKSNVDCTRQIQQIKMYVTYSATM